MLRTFTLEEQEEWDNLLPLVEFAYNNSINASTKVSPFFLMYGAHPITPSSLMRLPKGEEFSTKVAEVNEFEEHIHRGLHQAKEKLVIAQNRQKQHADAHRREVIFEVGDHVWLSTTNLSLVGTPKLNPRFIGPFLVLKRVGEVSYKLELPSHMKIYPVFHVSRLRKHVPRPKQFTNKPASPPFPTLIADHEEFEVEKILKKRIRGHKYPKVEYLIQLKGYPLYESTWEPAKNLANAPLIVQQFERMCNEDVAS